MNYCGIKKTDVANGPGVRVSLFVSGCRNRCPGCFNQKTWNFDYGEPFTDATLDELIKSLEPSYITGLSVLGGEPFEEENQEGVLAVLTKVRDVLPQKTVWLYSGYTYEELLSLKRTPNTLPILEMGDVLVDGKFDAVKKNPALRFRGSENQRVIDLPETLKNREVMLLKEFI